MMKTLLLLPLLLCVVACGGPEQGPNPATEAHRMETATRMRALFDSVKGDYSKLDAGGKAEFTRLCGDEAKAQAAWNVMKNGSAAAPTGTGAGANRP